MTTLRASLLAFALALALYAGPAQAQRTSGSVGLGGQVGAPTGVTLKFYNAGGPSYDVLAAWDLDDFFFLNVHAQFNQPINAENVDGLEWFIGPGAYVGVIDRVEDEAVLGISARGGLNYVLDRRFEFFVHLTPRFDLVPETDADVGGGVGFRYYF
jgi:hypothetical protein